jgi:RNA polymerase sigma factor (sigma-70 family)
MNDPDHQIIRRIIDGDARAYRMLVDRHKGHGMTVAMRMLKNREDAEEALQDAFVKAYRALDRFGFKARFSTWLYRILYNVCSDMLAKRKSHDMEIALEDTADEHGDALGPARTLASPDATPDVRVASDEMERIVVEEIDKLPRKYATVLTMFLLDEQSYGEIVEITGMPLGTVKTHLFRARTQLRNAVARRVGTNSVVE